MPKPSATPVGGTYKPSFGYQPSTNGHLPDFRLDEEIQSLLPKHTDEEIAGMKSQIKDGGHLDPLVVAVVKGERILADGYGRLQCCRTLGIDPHKIPTRDKHFPNREAMIQWVIDNQLSRRNLSDELRSYYRGKEYLNTKKPHGDQKRTSPSRQSDDLGATPENTGKKTTEAIAEKHDVSPKTIERDGQYAAAIDAMPEEEKAKTLAGEGKSRAKVIADAKTTRPVPSRPKRQKSEKNGAEKFIWKDFEKQFGPVARAPDKLANAYSDKNSSSHKSCLRLLSEFLGEFTKWHKQLTKSK